MHFQATQWSPLARARVQFARILNLLKSCRIKESRSMRKQEKPHIFKDRKGNQTQQVVGPDNRTPIRFVKRMEKGLNLDVKEWGNLVGVNGLEFCVGFGVRFQ